MADKTKSGTFSGAPFFYKCFLFAPAPKGHIITAHTRFWSQRQKKVAKLKGRKKHVRDGCFEADFYSVIGRTWRVNNASLFHAECAMRIGLFN